MKTLRAVGYFSIIFSLAPYASAELGKPGNPKSTDSNPKLEQPILKEAVKIYVDQSGCGDQKKVADSVESFLKMVDIQKSKEQKVVLTGANPDARSSNSVTYKFGGQKLPPGGYIYLWVPPDLAERGASFVILGHRQNPATTTGPKPGNKWDETPGLTSVQVYDANRTEVERWRHWAGDSSGNFGAKFAEQGTRFELENLYQWTKIGHRGVQSGDFKNDSLKGSAVRLTNVGTDEVEVSELVYKANLSAGSDLPTHIFTEGTKFGDVNSGEGYQVGGGQANKGIFPGAIDLGRSGQYQGALPAGWVYKKGKLVIPLPKGKVLTGIEVSAGDSHSDKIINSDGGFGTKGWARLNIELVRGGSVVDRLMSNENVPPEGILMGAPSRCGEIIQEGDSLVLHSASDTTYLGGLRLHLRNP